MDVDAVLAEVPSLAVVRGRVRQHRHLDITRGQGRAQVGAEALDAACVRREEFSDVQYAHEESQRRVFRVSLRRRISAIR